MTLRRRLLIAFVSLILITILLTLGVAYWTTQRNLDQFTNDMSEFEAQDLAQILSYEYSNSGGWETLEIVLFERGYLFGEANIPLDFELSQDELDEIFFEPFARVVVVDTLDQVIIDSFGEIEKNELLLENIGEESTIYDLRTGKEVGSIHVLVNSDYLAEESTAFLSDVVFTTLIGGLITAVIAIILAYWFSDRLTAPITALTKATEAISQQEEADLLPVTSNDELGQMSNSFNQMTLAMRTQRDLRKRLINDVSHELSTPLSVIQLEVLGLQDGMQSPEEASKQIIHEIDLLRNLVHDLNWLAETDSGELRLNREEADLADLLTTEVDRWQNQAQAKKIELILNPLPVLPTLSLDTVRMTQLLGNLLRNGIQHTPEEGSITISAELSSRSGQEGGLVAIKVADSGAGIHPADLPHLFERFYRTDPSRARNSGGSGLGLAIAKAIVEAHAGTISISSAGLGQGTTVQVELPIGES